jgi:hypothetical protein
MIEINPENSEKIETGTIVGNAGLQYHWSATVVANWVDPVLPA